MDKLDKSMKKNTLNLTHELILLLSLRSQTTNVVFTSENLKRK